VRSHLEAGAEIEGVDYLVGMLVMVHNRYANSRGESVQVSDKAET
jgi:hypothetical protein